MKTFWTISALCGLGALAFLDQKICMDLFDMSYLDWYKKNGSLIAGATTAAALVWGNAKIQQGLISANPVNYLGTCFQLIGLPIFVIGTAVRRSPVSLDTPLAMLMAIVTTLALFAWILLVVPLQYIIYLICGAPIRASLAASKIAIAKFENNKVGVDEHDKSKPIPQGWWNATFDEKPLVLPNLLALLIFSIWK